jgi:hypothetical protein
MRKRDETAHLLRSKRNSARLLSALKCAKNGVGKPEPIRELRTEMALVAGKRRKRST